MNLQQPFFRNPQAKSLSCHKVSMSFSPGCSASPNAYGIVLNTYADSVLSPPTTA